MSTFTKGEEVFLSVANCIVASGVVQKVWPDDTCQRTTIGEGRISVLIEGALNANCELPIPCPSAKTLGEAVDSCIIWDIANVSRKTVEDENLNGRYARYRDAPSDGVGDSLERCSPKSTEEDVDEDCGESWVPMNWVDIHLPNSEGTSPKSRKGKEKVKDRDFSMRSNWYSEHVQVFCPDRVSVLAEGVIVLVDVNSSVNNEPLDENHVGVGLGKIVRKEYFPNIANPTVAQCPVVKWSIHLLKSISHGMFMGDIVSKAAVVLVQDKDDDHVDDDHHGQQSSPKIYKVDVNQTRLRPTSPDGVDGDSVHLYLFEVPIAKGIVFKVDPFATCHNVAIGEGNVSVKVVEVMEGFHNKNLQYPHNGADTVGEALGSIIKWALKDVHKVGYMPPPLEVEQVEDPVEPEPPQPESTEGNDNAKSKDYKLRSNWNMQQVELYCPARVSVVAIGPITVPFPTSAVDNVQLGETHVGVTLAKIFKKEYFPRHMIATPVRWSITCVKLIDDGRFLGDILSEDKNESNDTPHVLKFPTPTKKRPYNFVKRKMADPEAKRLKRLSMKSSAKIMEEEIDDVKRKTCCGLKCCLNMPREDVEEARKEYHGMTPKLKTTYIMSLFLNRDKEAIDSGRMVLKEMTVCKFAFYTIHGFSRQKYYDYRDLYLNKGKVGFHGNTGTRKTRPNTMTAKAILENILRNSGEPMPHLSYNGGNGTDNIEYRLPSAFTRASIWEEVKDALDAADHLPIGFNTFGRVWAEYFANYKLHKTSAFAKCDICCDLKIKLHAERRPVERALLLKERAAHLAQQASRRHVYYSAKIMSKQEPQTYLCIIHDKMDQSKTWLPKAYPLPKYLSGTGHNLPIALTGMLTHGRAPGAYAHFSLTGLWPGDADFTVTSLAKLFSDLEGYHGDKSGDLSLDLTDPTKPIFKALMDPEAFKASYLQPRNIDISRFKGEANVKKDNHEDNSTSAGSSSTAFTPLPPHLTIQMDNSGKDNKNQHIISYASDLVSRGHFVEIILSFLMTGHTHEDVDALFLHASRKISGVEIPTLHQLMAEVWECTDIHPVPRLIQEVAAYKDYLKTFKPVAIIGQSQPIQFRFSMRENIPIYQYKGGINEPWIPVEGRCIWSKVPNTNNLNVPQGEPLAKEMDQYYNDAKEVVSFIRRYVEYILRSCSDETSVAYRERQPLIKHWETIANILEGEIGRFSIGNTALPLSKGFWPKTNHGTGYKAVGTDTLQTNANDGGDEIQNPNMVELQNELNEEMQGRGEIFVGSRKEKERERWLPLSDIKKGDFIILNPSHDWEQTYGKGRFWLVKALSIVDANHASDGGEYPMFQIEWWRPKHGQVNAEDNLRYSKCFAQNTSWERDPGYADTQESWQLASSSIYGWSSRAKPENLAKSGLKIPKSILQNITTYIRRLELTSS